MSLLSAFLLTYMINCVGEHKWKHKHWNGHGESWTDPRWEEARKKNEEIKFKEDLYPLRVAERNSILGWKLKMGLNIRWQHHGKEKKSSHQSSRNASALRKSASLGHSDLTINKMFFYFFYFIFFRVLKNDNLKSYFIIFRVFS